MGWFGGAVTERLADEEVIMLARVFHRSSSAMMVLERAGLERWRQPSWTERTSLEFWEEVQRPALPGSVGRRPDQPPGRGGAALPRQQGFRDGRRSDAHGGPGRRGTSVGRQRPVGRRCGAVRPGGGGAGRPAPAAEPGGARRRAAGRRGERPGPGWRVARRAPRRRAGGARGRGSHAGAAARAARLQPDAGRERSRPVAGGAAPGAGRRR
ncbi:effector-associated domain EAD1-containing protein [Candidatus Frankia alpina]|uniref:effector-associated domain EAD1-containing protein n=1 Tax=Candidatus Frankia alpina TaxID=2699483 RepID=UPI003AF96ACD